MEMPARSTVLNLFAISFAVGLLITVFVDFTRPQLSRLEPFSGKSPALEDNWFPLRTFHLLSGELSPPAGIDVNGMTKRNPFERVPVPGEFAASEPPGVEPEPTPLPPATREISVVYRGIYRTSGGDPFVYVEVENVTEVYPVGGQMISNWTIVDANANELILEQAGQEHMQFPFNEKKSLEVPIQ